MQNWQSSLSATSYGVNWKKYLPEDLSAEDVLNIEKLKSYLEKNFYLNGKIDEFLSWLNKNVNSNQIQNDLEILMSKRFVSDRINVFVTTFHRAPYNVANNFFYIIFRDSKEDLAIRSIYHELLHFMFHWYFWNDFSSSGFSDFEIHDFKEALTVILNPTLEKRGLPLDIGYPDHQELRKNVEELWTKEKDFSVFINNAILMYRNYLIDNNKKSV